MKIYQYLELQTIDRANYDLLSQYYIECVAVYLDVDTEEVEEMSYDEVLSLFEELSNKIKSTREGCNSFSIDGFEFYKKPLNQLTLAEFIDLEHYLQNGQEVEMICVLYRLKEKEHHFKADEWEEYGNFVNKRKELFLELDAFSVLGIVREYMLWRDSFFQSYSSFFSLGEDEAAEEEDLAELTGKEKRDYLNELAKERQMQQYAYEKLIMDLAGGDITKTKDVLSLGLIYVFNIKSMLKTISDV